MPATTPQVEHAAQRAQLRQQLEHRVERQLAGDVVAVGGSDAVVARARALDSGFEGVVARERSVGGVGALPAPRSQQPGDTEADECQTGSDRDATDQQLKPMEFERRALRPDDVAIKIT